MLAAKCHFIFPFPSFRAARAVNSVDLFNSRHSRDLRGNDGSSWECWFKKFSSQGRECFGPWIRPDPKHARSSLAVNSTRLSIDSSCSGSRFSFGDFSGHSWRNYRIVVIPAKRPRRVTGKHWLFCANERCTARPWRALTAWKPKLRARFTPRELREP